METNEQQKNANSYPNYKKFSIKKKRTKKTSFVVIEVRVAFVMEENYLNNTETHPSGEYSALALVFSLQETP